MKITKNPWGNQRGHVESMIGMMVVGIILAIAPPLIKTLTPELHETIRTWFVSGGTILVLLKTIITLGAAWFLVVFGGIFLGVLMRRL